MTGPEKQDMDANGVRIVATMYDRLSDGDLDAIQDYVAPDARIIEAQGLPYSGTYTGPTGLSEIFAIIFAKATMEVSDRVIERAGDRVMATMNVTFVARATGRSVVTPVVELFTVVEDRVTELDIYYKDSGSVAALFTEV